MSKTNNGKPTQGRRTVGPGWELKLVPEDEKPVGTTEGDLGQKWGLQGQAGPRRTRGSESQVVPGGLETSQDENESHVQCLDQPETGGDRQNEFRLDQANEASDRRDSLDQPSQEGSDRPTPEPKPGTEEKGSDGMDNGSEGTERGVSPSNEDGDDEAENELEGLGSEDPGPPTAIPAWRRVM